MLGVVGLSNWATAGYPMQILVPGLTPLNVPHNYRREAAVFETLRHTPETLAGEANPVRHNKLEFREENLVF